MSTASCADERPGRWAEITPSVSPPAQIMGEMVYCSSVHKLIMFNGADRAPGAFETWAYDPDAGTWAALSPEGGPPPERTHYGVAYVPDIDRVILFGGGDSLPRFNDLWAYDPNSDTWTELRPSGQLPPETLGPGFAYDSTAKRIVMFGGLSTTEWNHTWAYDPVLNSWTDLDPPESPPGDRVSPTMVYAPSSGAIVLWGGIRDPSGSEDATGTWEYNFAENRWSKVASGGPSGRWGEAAAYDATREQVVMFGGAAATDALRADVWAYDSVTKKWAEAESAGAPAGRFFPAWAFDPVGDRFIMFGGGGAVPLPEGGARIEDLGDTWSYRR